MFDPLGVAFPTIAGWPSKEEATTALALLKHLLAEFPFAKPQCLAVALSGILTTLARAAMSTAPLHAFSAPTPGTGKGFLVDLTAIIATGKPAPTMGQGENEGEFEKRLVALARRGDSIVSIDNITAPLGGDFLNQMLTQADAKGRILGKSEMVDIPPTITLFATGNNLRVVGDTTRRALICRMDTGLENPEQRKFTHDPLALLKGARARYVAAGLTILRAYIAAGRPSLPTPLASFVEWSNLVRGALLWLGEADPVATLSDAKASDTTRERHGAILAHWHTQFGSEPVLTKAVVQKALQDQSEFGDAVRAVSMGRTGPFDAEALGRYVAKYEDVPLSGLRFKRGTKRDGYQQWSVVPTA
jgi:hypothetical protein